MTGRMTLSNGMKVRCRFCAREHQIRGYKGNNIRWFDQDGWGGSFDVAHGTFDPMTADTVCLECGRLSGIERQKLLDDRIDSLVAWQTC